MIFIYSVSLKKSFLAYHKLPFAEGEESLDHSHEYVIQVIFFGKKLDEKGYLLDINLIEDLLDEIISDFRRSSLNDVSDFENIFPTIENFCKVFWNRLNNDLDNSRIKKLKVKIWEDEDAFASYSGVLDS